MKDPNSFISSKQSFRSDDALEIEQDEDFCSEEIEDIDEKLA